MSDVFLSVAELAGKLGCSPEFVRVRIKSGEWPHHRLGTRTYRFSPEDVQAILDMTRVSHKQEPRDELDELQRRISAMKAMGASARSIKTVENKRFALLLQRAKL